MAKQQKPTSKKKSDPDAALLREAYGGRGVQLRKGLATVAQAEDRRSASAQRAGARARNVAGRVGRAAEAVGKIGPLGQAQKIGTRIGGNIRDALKKKGR